MITTFEQYVSQEQARFPGATGEFTLLMSGIALATKMIQSQVRRADLAGILGSLNEVNVQGEVQQKLDVYANEALIHCLSLRKSIGLIASEENEEPITLGHRSPDAQYAIVFDPLDGSSNIDVAITIGTTFSIFRRPRQGQYYSINEAYCDLFPELYCNYLARLRSGALGRRYSSRFVGSMVADFHRTLLRGGVFVYPAITGFPSGKLRLLYEANPVAFLAEQAGGSASDGTQPILDVQPHDIHQRTPLVVGSEVEMAEFERCVRQCAGQRSSDAAGTT